MAVAICRLICSQFFLEKQKNEQARRETEKKQKSLEKSSSLQVKN